MVSVDGPEGLTVWITRQANGMYLLTTAKPVIADVKGTGRRDAYIRYGDPVGQRNMCGLVLRHFGVERELEPLESVRVK